MFESSHVELTGTHSLPQFSLGCVLLTCILEGCHEPYSGLQKVGTGPGAIYAGFPSSLGFGVGRQSYSNFLAGFYFKLFKKSCLYDKHHDHTSGPSNLDGSSEHPGHQQLCSCGAHEDLTFLDLIRLVIHQNFRNKNSMISVGSRRISIINSITGSSQEPSMSKTKRPFASRDQLKLLWGPVPSCST